MDQNGQVDPKTLNKFMTWQAGASAMIWTLCVGAASAPDTSSRTSIVLAVGATIYMVIVIGSSFWTGYSQEVKRTKPRTDVMENFYSISGMLSLGSTLFLLNFSNGYFIEGDELGRALLRAFLLGACVAGAMYLMYVRKRRKK
jgi:hypothetical protein